MIKNGHSTSHQKMTSMYVNVLINQKKALLLAIAMLSMFDSMTAIYGKRERKKVARGLKTFIAIYKKKMLSMRDGGRTFLDFLEMATLVRSRALEALVADGFDGKIICPATIIWHTRNYDRTLFSMFGLKDSDINDYVRISTIPELSFHSRRYMGKIFIEIDKSVTDGYLVYSDYMKTGEVGKPADRTVHLFNEDSAR